MAISKPYKKQNGTVVYRVSYLANGKRWTETVGSRTAARRLYSQRLGIGFERTLGFQPNAKAAVLIFGLFHGFGLATKLQEFELPQEGLLHGGQSASPDLHIQ